MKAKIQLPYMFWCGNDHEFNLITYALKTVVPDCTVVKVGCYRVPDKDYGVLHGMAYLGDLTNKKNKEMFVDIKKLCNEE